MAKIFERTFLPDQIKYNKKVWVYNGHLSAKNIMFKEKPNEPYIIVKVLSRNLRKATDLHGKSYQPSEHIYTIKK